MLSRLVKLAGKSGLGGFYSCSHHGHEVLQPFSCPPVRLALTVIGR